MPRAHAVPIAKTAIAFNRLYGKSKRPVWDVDGPARFVQELVEAGSIKGDVLDAGCGTGENAIYLAAQGFHVVAFDAAPAAVEKARRKAGERGVACTVEVADARSLPDWGPRFGTLIDSGLFHVMAKPGDRLRYAAALRKVSPPGAVLHLLAFEERGPRWFNQLKTALRTALTGIGTHGVSSEEIRAAFSAGWSIESIEEKQYGWCFPAGSNSKGLGAAVHASIS